MAQPSKLPGRKPMTRPRRKRLYGGLIGIILGITAVVLWAAYEVYWTAGLPPMRMRVLGLFDYLTIREIDVGAMGGRGPAYRRWLEWEAEGLMATVLLTAGVVVTCMGIYRWGMNRKLTDLCDECGYAIAESNSTVCPECGPGD